MGKQKKRESRDELLKTIDVMFGEANEKNIFPYHIYYLRFPFFKNYEENLKINFSYPITFITGMNGIGKSSLLHALYGSIRGHSIARFWFETGLDPIEESKQNKNRIICSFKTLFTKQQVETLVTRMPRKNNPDYWEPSEPLKKYGMISLEKRLELSEKEKKERSKDRWNQQKRKVYYIDFRHMLGAYDKFFYFSNPDEFDSIYDIQKRIRKEAKSIADAFDKQKSVSKYKNSRKIEKPVIFSEDIIEEICYILGKNYKTISYSEHDLYSKVMGKGFVMRYTLEDKQYSEAYAGSGESTIAKMIYDLREIEENALILIDEPEISLHPQAQKKLVDYLLKIIIEKKAQIVISTHSPDMIYKMPSKAINVLYENSQNHKVNVMEKVYYENAFFHIGHDVTKKRIYVEDKLAKELISRVIERENIRNIEVEILGGAEELFKCMAMFSKAKTTDIFFVLDGDQKFEKIDIKDLKDNEKEIKILDEKIEQLLRCKDKKIKTSTLSLDGKTKDESINNRINFLDFQSKFAYFLPKEIPEEIIYSDEIDSLKISNLDEIRKEKNFKNKFSIISVKLFGENSSEYIFKTQEIFLKNWIEKKNEDYMKIKSILNDISKYSVESLK